MMHILLNKCAKYLYIKRKPHFRTCLHWPRTPTPRGMSHIWYGILMGTTVQLLRQCRSFSPQTPGAFSRVKDYEAHNKESNRVKTLRHAATTSSCSSLSFPLLTSSEMTCPRFAPTPPEAPPVLFPKGH